MKKFLSKITVLVLALMMVFALGACGGNKDKDKTDNTPQPGTAGEAINGAVDSMLNKDSFTAKVKAKATIPDDGGKPTTQEINYDAAVKKTTNDYDFKVTMSSGEYSETPVVKVGDILYTYSNGGNSAVNPDVPGYAYPGERIAAQADSSADAAVWRTEYVAPGTVKEAIDGVKEQISQLTSVGSIEKKDGYYTIDVKEEFGKDFAALVAKLESSKDDTVANFLAGYLGDANYNGDALKADINTILADNVTLKNAAAGVDALLSHAGLPITMKKVADMQFERMGITADTVYKQFKDVIENLKAPTAGQTAYDYMISVCGDMKLDDLINSSKPEQEVTAKSIREMVIGVLDSKVGATYDQYAVAFIDQYVYDTLRKFGMGGMYESITTDNKFASVENLKKFTFADNSNYVSLKVVFDKDLSLKEISANAKVDINYGGEPLIGGVDGTIGVTFNYDAVTIEVPATGDIKPCIKTADNAGGDGYIDITTLPETGSYTIDVYTGKGYTIELMDCTGCGLTGVSYADGKITLSAEDIATIRKNGNGHIALKYYKTENSYSTLDVYFSNYND